MTFSSLLNISIKLLLLSVLFDQSIITVEAGNCFNHRINDMCYDLSEADVNEDQCTGLYYSEDTLKELDGYVYAEKCRDVNLKAKRCDIDCGLGQECQWIDGIEMCVCSEEACHTSKHQHQPVCASNNMTFSSECSMEAWKCFNRQSGLYKKYDGQCQKDCQNVNCPHNTVCLLVKNSGEPFCFPKKRCDAKLDPEPVCGTDGITYENICAMRLSPDNRGRTAELAHKGPCESQCRPNLCKSSERCVLSLQSRPTCIRCAPYSSRFYGLSGECSTKIAVCGDDQYLYKNYCLLLREQCERSRFINIIDYDQCPKQLNFMQ